MKKMGINKLLEKYYSGETNLQEEAELKSLAGEESDEFEEEQLVFSFYKTAAEVPAGLEEQLLAGIQQHDNKTRTLKTRWRKYGSIAAAVCLFASVFWFTTQNNRKQGLTDDEQFAIMEQALMEVSFGMQPPENEELLVLFQDENLEIVVE